MDLLLSLPLLNTLLTPSWSTSLNLLFFYATWSTLVLTHSPAKLHLGALLSIRILLWLIPTLFILLFDTFLPSLSKGIKFRFIPTPSLLPPGGRGTGRTALWNITTAVGNMLLLTIVETGLAHTFFILTKGTSSTPLFQTATTLPLPWTILKHILILFTSREILTHYTHRFLLHSLNSHTPTLRTLHTSSNHHSLPLSPLSLFSDHPLPLLLLRIPPIFLPSLIIRPHLLTYILFSSLITLEGTLSHSGYSIVPGIFLGGIARRTAIHHASRGTANFGPWGFLDWVHGTSKGGDVLEDVCDEAEKHNVRERGAQKVDESVGLLQEGVAAVRRSGRKRTPKKSWYGD